MKEKVYSITLLLAFLAVLTHQMIPHHHDESTLDIFSSAHNLIKEYSNHEDHGHHHHENNHHEDDSEKTNDSHNHSFPQHKHSVASDDYSFVRLTSGSITSLKVISLIAPQVNNAISIAKQPITYKQELFPDTPFPINSLFQPGAIGLRAPPSMA